MRVFSYKIDLDNKINEDDIVLSKDNIKVLINKSFIPYLRWINNRIC